MNAVILLSMQSIDRILLSMQSIDRCTTKELIPNIEYIKKIIPYYDSTKCIYWSVDFFFKFGQRWNCYLETVRISDVNVFLHFVL